MTEIREHLVNYLTDAYSIERQALAQMKTAPDVAGEPRLAAAFRQHLEETERQAEMVEKRLQDLGGSPKRVKDAIMGIRDEERAMMERIENALPAAADASLEDADREDLQRKLRSYLADAHALEVQSIQLLEHSPDIAGDPELARIYREHLAETRMHARWVEEQLETLGGDVSKLKDLALRAAALNWGLFFQAHRDTPGKLAVFAYAIEHLEAAGYEMLRRVAQRMEDGTTVALADRILTDERSMADRLAGAFDLAFEASMAELEVPSEAVR